VVGKLVPRGKSNSARSSRGIDQIHACNLRFLASIFRLERHAQRFPVSSQDGAVSLITPFRSGADGAWVEPPTPLSNPVHSDAVGFLSRAVHLLGLAIIIGDGYE